MNYTRLAKAIALTMPLALMAGCTNDDSNDDTGSGVVPPPTSSGPVIGFDPDNGIVPFPSDIFGYDEDGTLKMPGESNWQGNTDGTESANAYWNYLGSQDGWGTSVPIVVRLNASDTESTVEINSDTLEAGVKLYKNENGTLTPLTYNEDYRAIISAKRGTLNIEPLKPFMEGTQYYVALTTSITDTKGESIQPSEAYRNLLTSSDDLGQHLQGVIDQLTAAGLSETEIAYGAVFKTTSMLDILRPVVDRYLDEFSADTRITIEHEAVEQAETTSNIVTDAVEKALNEADADAESASAPAPTDRNYRRFIGNINLPYYLDTPDSNSGNCTYNQYVPSLADNAPENFNEYRVAPQEFCPGAFSFWQTGQAANEPSGIPVTGNTADDLYIFKAPKDNPVKVFISIPKEETFPRPEAGYKTFLYAHGYGSSKAEIDTIAADLAAKGYAMIALDQPMHGDRMVDIDGDGTHDLDASLRRTDYVMGDNLLTTRGFMQQTMVDYVGLRMAIANGVLDNGLVDAEGTGNLLMDTNNVHMAGLSLGGITSTSVTALLRDTQEQHPDLAEKLNLKTTSIGVPGGGVASVIIQSPLLEAEVKADFFESAVFRLHMAKLLDLYNPLTDLDKDAKVAALDEHDVYREVLADTDFTNVDGIENPEEKEKAEHVAEVYAELTAGTEAELKVFGDFEEAGWQSFVGFAEREAQSTIDPADPTNMATVLAEHKDTPLFLVEAVGDGSNTFNTKDIFKAIAGFGVWNPGDFIILNQTQEMPLGGTDPLIRTLGLDILTEAETTGSTDNPIRGAARYGYGTHMSMAVGVPLEDLVSPNLLPHDVDVHNSIIKGILSMAESNGESIELIHEAENGDPLLLDADALPDQPEYKK